MRGKLRKRKGIVGIEAAIVMIAFIIVAAALAFVTLNMGMFTTQRAKEVMARGLSEASSALEIDGSATGLTNSNSRVVNISIPIKLAPGRESVDLRSEKVTISLIAGRNSYADIHSGVYILKYSSSGVNVGNETYKWYLEDATNTDNKVGVSQNDNYPSVKELALALNKSGPAAVVVFIKTLHDDTVLEFGEKAIVLVFLDNGLSSYDTFTLEIRPPEGAPLTVQRTMPAILPPDSAVDLG